MYYFLLNSILSMAHRSAYHEKAYRKGKVALSTASAKKAAAGAAARDFLGGKFKTAAAAAREYEVDPMAVTRRIWYLFLSRNS